jgi:N-acetylglucosaminyldiphosphoundecaprenol N-acetyl-beta-D-mannosaminyltransferase
MERNTISFLDVKVDVVDTQGLCDRIVSFAHLDEKRQVMYVNTDCMLLAGKNEHYRQVLNKSDLVYADGVGVVWGAKLWGNRLPGRSTGADFLPEFCKVFAENGLRVFLLGAKDPVAREAAAKLIEKVPDLQIVGAHNGYFTKEETSTVIHAVNTMKPHIVIVGMGAPYQEIWMDANRDAFDAPVLWGVGGLFDFISGRTKRGPQWLLDHGFEWLCRLVVEPRRLWKRYLIGNTKFVLYILWARFISKKYN